MESRRKLQKARQGHAERHFGQNRAREPEETLLLRKKCQELDVFGSFGGRVGPKSGQNPVLHGISAPSMPKTKGFGHFYHGGQNWRTFRAARHAGGGEEAPIFS